MISNFRSSHLTFKTLNDDFNHVLIRGKDINKVKFKTLNSE